MGLPKCRKTPNLAHEFQEFMSETMQVTKLIPEDPDCKGWWLSIFEFLHQHHQR